MFNAQKQSKYAIGHVALLSGRNSGKIGGFICDCTHLPLSPSYPIYTRVAGVSGSGLTLQPVRHFCSSRSTAFFHSDFGSTWPLSSMKSEVVGVNVAPSLAGAITVHTDFRDFRCNPTADTVRDCSTVSCRLACSKRYADVKISAYSIVSVDTGAKVIH